jgi:hypothetical protein
MGLEEYSRMQIEHIEAYQECNHTPINENSQANEAIRQPLTGKSDHFQISNQRTKRSYLQLKQAPQTTEQHAYV